MTRSGKAIPHRIAMVSVLLGVAIMLLAWLGSDDEPEGCYRIDSATRLAVADGTVRLLGKHGGEARIVSVDRVRGWVLTLDHGLAFDPARSHDARFIRGKATPRADILFIDQRAGQPPTILFHPAKGADVRFPEVACETAPKG